MKAPDNIIQSSENELPKYFIDKKYNKRRIIGIDDMSYSELKNEISNGKRFLTFQFVISFIIFFFQKSSDIYFTNNQKVLNHTKISYSIISALSFVIMATFLMNADFSFINSMDKDLLSIIILIFMLFWFGGITLLPILAIINNLRGGIDVTEEILLYIESNKVNK